MLTRNMEGVDFNAVASAAAEYLGRNLTDGGLSSVD